MICADCSHFIRVNPRYPVVKVFFVGLFGVPRPIPLSILFFRSVHSVDNRFRPIDLIGRLAPEHAKSGRRSVKSRAGSGGPRPARAAPASHSLPPEVAGFTPPRFIISPHFGDSRNQRSQRKWDAGFGGCRCGSNSGHMYIDCHRQRPLMSCADFTKNRIPKNSIRPVWLE